MKNILIISLLLITSAVVQMIADIPWWSFIIPCFLFGSYLSTKKISGYLFIPGFVAGFTVWLGTTLFCEWQYPGAIMGKVSSLFGVPYALLLVAIGFIGGLLSGLSVYSGSLLIKKESAELEI